MFKFNTAPLLQEFEIALIKNEYDTFLNLLKEYDPNNIYNLYDDLFDTISHKNKFIIFDLLIESGFRGNETQTLVEYLSTIYLNSYEFCFKYIFVLLEAGYDISSTKRAKIDGIKMAQLLINGSCDKMDLLKKFLAYKPDLSESLMDELGIDLIHDAIDRYSERVRILLEYGVGSHKNYIKNISYIMDRIKNEYPDISENIQLSDFNEDDYHRNCWLKSYMESLNYLRQYTATITKPNKNFRTIHLS